jgi:hypothetical protein
MTVVGLEFPIMCGIVGLFLKDRALEPAATCSPAIEEFHARLADTPHTWVEWSCSQLLQNTPLHPIAEWGRPLPSTHCPQTGGGVSLPK